MPEAALSFVANEIPTATKLNAAFNAKASVDAIPALVAAALGDIDLSGVDLDAVVLQATQKATQNATQAATIAATESATLAATQAATQSVSQAAAQAATIVTSQAVTSLVTQAANAEVQRILSTPPYGGGDTADISLTVGTTAERPSPARVGMRHYNVDLGALETFIGGDIGWWTGAAVPPLPPPDDAILLEPDVYWMEDGVYVVSTPADPNAFFFQPVVVVPQPELNGFVDAGYVEAGYFAAS